MAMPTLLAPLVAWIFKAVIVKFVVLSAIVAVLVMVVPMAAEMLVNFIAPGALTNAFAAINPTIWFYLDVMQMGYGMPLCIAAIVTRFLIRRLPVIG